jgi:hypothetical protein
MYLKILQKDVISKHKPSTIGSEIKAANGENDARRKQEM